MKKLALALLAALLLLLAVVLIRTARFGEAQGAVPAAAAYTAPAGAAERLAEAIRIPTISHEGIHGADERISVADYDAAIPSTASSF